MTDEQLHSFVAQLNADVDFRAKFEHDAPTALAEYGLSDAEQMALASNDEDALRRLPGADVPEMATSKCIWSWVTRHLCTWVFCGPPGTRDWQCKNKPS